MSLDRCNWSSLRWAAAAALLVGCAEADPVLEVSHAYVVAPAAGETAVLYLTISNRGTRPDSLLGIETEAAGSIDLHEQVYEGGIVRMAPASDLVVPARGTLAMVPGGGHAMVNDLRNAVAAGDTIKAMLLLRDAGRIGVRIPVIGYADLENAFGPAGSADRLHGGH